jgi:dTDP-glucose 4,6-dehydratase
LARALKVLVTGANGFIGSNIVGDHLASGDIVIGLDNFITSVRGTNLEKHLSHNNFLFHATAVDEFIDHMPMDFDVIYHFASPASPVKYQRYGLETMKVNTLSTIKMLERIEGLDTRFVFASTSEVYGNPLEHPQSESYLGNVNPIGVRGVYDESKRFGETITNWFRVQKKVNTGILRIFNSYGPGMHKDDGRVVSTMISQALEQREISVFGDGRQTRSFCFISDLVDGIRRFGASNQPGPINLGNPNEVTVLSLAQTIKTQLQSTSTISFFDSPIDDPQQRCPDITLASSLLSWKPVVKLEEGIRLTADWMKLQI